MNRLMLIKCSMYGPAGLDLLRQRVLYAVWGGPGTARQRRSRATDRQYRTGGRTQK